MLPGSSLKGRFIAHGCCGQTSLSPDNDLDDDDDENDIDDNDVYDDMMIMIMDFENHALGIQDDLKLKYNVVRNQTLRLSKQILTIKNKVLDAGIVHQTFLCGEYCCHGLYIENLE